MTETRLQRSPVVIGTVTLDIIHVWNDEHSKRTVQLNFGGVCKHVACTLGTLKLNPRFVSVRFSGEVGDCISRHLERNDVEWFPLPLTAPLSLFQAEVDLNGNVGGELFLDGGSLDQLTPSVLRSNDYIFADARAILTCTDLMTDSLHELYSIATVKGLPLWLLSSSVEEVEKFRALAKLPVAISMNLAELQALTDTKPHKITDIAAVAQQLVAEDGICLVTLGSRGAILCEYGRLDFLYQPVPCITGKSTISAGDVFFACLLAAHINDQQWPKALHFAAVSTAAYIKKNDEDKGEMRYLNLANTSEKIPLPQRILL